MLRHMFTSNIMEIKLCNYIAFFYHVSRKVNFRQSERFTFKIQKHIFI